MRLLLVRHAESEGNARGDYSIKIADSLSARGEAQARALASLLQEWEFDRIIVSPLQRTLQTIAPYLSVTGRRAEIWPEVAEACWHQEREEPAADWHSRPASPPDGIAHLFTYRDGRAIRPADPESFGEGLRRVHATIDLLRGVGGRTVLMVTHGHFIREILNALLELQSPTKFPHENCGMTLISLGERWTIEPL